MELQNLDALIEETELPQEFDGIPVFIVGGAVRDTLRGVDVEDIDLMVAEVPIEEMRARKGFREIDSPNNDTFGVFQDSLGREVALAREERSTGDGHDEFEIEPVPASVEAGEAAHRDLKRRDFTVNAMALDARWGVVLDPHDGFTDLQNGVVRAVDSTAFRQDPLRIIRGARFAARLDAEIEEHTLEQMSLMVGKLDALPEERIRMELEKALVQADEPSQFFEILDDVGALETAFPELAELRGVSAGPDEFHKEEDTFVHTMMVLDEMSELRPDDELAMLMAIAHDLGKAVTDDGSDSHGGHGKEGDRVAANMAVRLSMSNEQRNAMREAARHHMKFHDITDLRTSTVVEMVQQIDHMDRMFDLARADSAGRIPSTEWRDVDAKRRVSAAEYAVNRIGGQFLIDDGHDPEEMGGEEFGNLLHQRRVELARAVGGGKEA